MRAIAKSSGPATTEITMSMKQIEARVVELEREVARLKGDSGKPARPKDWRGTIGAFSNDPFMERVFEEAEKFREANRRSARRTGSRSKGQS